MTRAATWADPRVHGVRDAAVGKELNMERSGISIGRGALGVLGVAAVAAVVLIMVGCNTVKGAGRDLEEASDNTSRAIHNATNGN